MDTEAIVYVRHLRTLGHCSRGARQWAEAHGVDWSDFLKNGIPVSVLRSFNDALGNSLADIAEREQNGR